jgi:RHS repeat-associated protein
MEQNFTIKQLQPRATNRHAVFLSHARETLTYHYERDPDEPRIGHALTLEVDLYGHVLRSLSIGYGRRSSPLATQGDRDRQTTTLITYTENAFTNAVDDPDAHRMPLPSDSSTYELTGFIPAHGAARFGFEEWSAGGFVVLDNASAAHKRLLSQMRILYRRNDLTGLLPLHDLESLALPGESYRLALTPARVAGVFKRKRPGQPDEDLLAPNPAAILEGAGADLGGYVAFDGNWWVPSGTVFYAEAATTATLELAEARSHFFLPRLFRDPFGNETRVRYGTSSDLLVTRTKDELDNIVSAENDYRVLQPRLVTDANRNRAAAAFDALGMVVATAVMGKDDETLGDLIEDVDPDPPLTAVRSFVSDPETRAASMLGKATTRIVYDLDRFRRVGQPPFVAALARETHLHDLAPGEQSGIQTSFAYSDGFGREIQRKTQAEPGDAPRRQTPGAAADVRPGALVRDAAGDLVEGYAPHRWVGSGRTVFNNKAKPVKQYEPFFSATHLYERETDLTDTGVSPVLFYDPVTRVVATLHPNHTYEKVTFDPWLQTTYDVNDTVAQRGLQTGDPRTDPDIAGSVRGYFETEPAGWETWYAERIALPPGLAELDAATKAAAHADTPTVAHLDTLGRPFMTVLHNRYERNGTVVEERFATRIELDVEGNQRAVGDERTTQSGALEQRVVMRYDYDLLRNCIHQSSMEAGERWTLHDVAGKQIRTWDSRRFQGRTTYDELRRSTGLYVTDAAGTERLAVRTVYGESQGDAANLRGRVYQVFDEAGILTSVRYDFKGNLRESTRDLLPFSAQPTDWLLGPTANDGRFTCKTTYDALNRVLASTAPDGSVYEPTFNEANLLDKVQIRLRGAVAATSFVTNINYNAKGQRTLVNYMNGAQTTYEYDPLTFRLTQLTTTRAGPDATAAVLFKTATVIQDLRYSYDPVGNITQIDDAALKTIFHGNQQVDPVGRFTYDALYRLTEAQGREHIGQMVFEFAPADANYRDYPFVGQRDQNDLQAVRNYTEHYDYDAAGNFQTVRHIASGGSWTRTYECDQNSLLESGRKSNRLSGTTIENGFIRGESYAYDAHGNTIAMPHLPSLSWDFADRLKEVALAGGAASYVYDAAGQRVRKVIMSADGTRRSERIYVGAFEVYREFAADGTEEKLERQSLHVLDDKQRIALVDTELITEGNAVADPLPVERYQLGNHLGSASLELSGDGGLISYEEYHPYGTTAFQAGRSAAETSLKRYRYIGKERDEESGLYYHGARYYAPWLGRWTSCDRVLKDGLNRYAALGLNPIRFVDRSGNQKEPPDSYPSISAAPPYYGTGYFRPTLNPPHPGDELADILINGMYFLPGGFIIGPLMQNLWIDHQVEHHEISPEDAALARASLTPWLPTPTPKAGPPAKAAPPKGVDAKVAPAPSPGPPEPAPQPAPTVPTAASSAGSEPPVPVQAPALDPATPTPASPASPPKPAAAPTAAPAPVQQPGAGAQTTAATTKQPPQFRVGNAGEEMAKFSMSNSDLNAPQVLLNTKSTLKDAATGKTRYATAGKKDARYPDVPVPGEANAVGGVEQKTPYGSPPVDPLLYLQTHPKAAAQMSKEAQIEGQGPTTWGPAGGPQWSWDPGEGPGLATGYWQWNPRTGFSQ